MRLISRTYKYYTLWSIFMVAVVVSGTLYMLEFMNMGWMLLVLLVMNLGIKELLKRMKA